MFGTIIVLYRYNKQSRRTEMFKTILNKIKSMTGNSLAEFAVTTAMMATLAATAALSRAFIAALFSILSDKDPSFTFFLSIAFSMAAPRVFS